MITIALVDDKNNGKNDNEKSEEILKENELHEKNFEKKKYM